MSSRHRYPEATPVAVGVPVQAGLLPPAPHAALTPCDSAAARSVRIRTTALSVQKPALPPGLCNKLAKAVENFPLRILIADNSGSMRQGDGSRLIAAADGRSVRKLRSTRWQELGGDVMELAKMSIALEARTDIHLLNPCAGFGAMSVGPSWDGVAPLGPSVDMSQLARAMATSPHGTTPLTESVMQVVSMIAPSAPALRARGEQVCVIIATDGLPNDPSSFLEAVQALQSLPVWMVVRLCTDDSGVVSYWNELDAHLEAPLEVLDDVESEAEEVHAHNPWLTYSEPLHSARLFGLPGKLFDEIDEKALLPSQCREFVEDLLGVDCALPEPELDPGSFIDAVKLALSSVPPVYDPRGRGQLRSWIDISALEKHVKSGGHHAGPCIIL